ncbi:hypothetical protein OIO90_003318 [Microbotryomycetes sp. JL221]|nr:hypothetical protein OIO90_003318 [Microbotryomycetes sp. JL221]
MGLFEPHHVTGPVDIENPTWLKDGGQSNSYLQAQQSLLMEMYPPFKPGFKTRTIILVVILVLVIVMSLLFLWTSNLETRRRNREPWTVRVIQRPAGRYLVLNQYRTYPICAIVLSALWIAYTFAVYNMFGGQYAKPYSLFFWIPINYIPFFCLLSTTTFAVLSGANLASQGTKPNSHRLGPILANSVYIVLIPLIVVTISTTGIWTGLKWKSFGHAWEDAYLALGQAGQQFNGTVDWQLNYQIQNLLQHRYDTYNSFEQSQYVCTVVYVLSACCLILINVTGGFYLLATLRSVGQGPNRNVPVPRNLPLVAPLEPFKSDKVGPPNSIDSTRLNIVESSVIEDVKDEPKETGLQDMLSSSSPVIVNKSRRPTWILASSGSTIQQGCGNHTTQTKLKRLQWDVLLQPAFCITLISLSVLTVKSIWILNSRSNLVKQRRQDMFESVGQGHPSNNEFNNDHQRKGKFERLFPFVRKFSMSNHSQLDYKTKDSKQRLTTTTEQPMNSMSYIPQLAWNWSMNTEQSSHSQNQIISKNENVSPYDCQTRLPTTTTAAATNNNNLINSMSQDQSFGISDLSPPPSSSSSPSVVLENQKPNQESFLERRRSSTVFSNGGYFENGCVQGVVITSVRETTSESV